MNLLPGQHVKYLAFAIVASIASLAYLQWDVISLPLLPTIGTATTSAWFQSGGYLYIDLETGLDTTYEIPRSGGVDNTKCDQERYIGHPSDSSHSICVNRMLLSSALLRNLEAQKSIVEGGSKDMSDADRILRETFPILKAIRGKRVLIIGDSMDRYWVDDLVWQYGQLGVTRTVDFKGGVSEDYKMSSYKAKTTSLPIQPDVEAALQWSRQSHPYDGRNLSPETVRFDLLFVHIMLETDELDFYIQEVFPSSSSRRLEIGAKMWGGAMNDEAPYDMIALNLGIWEFLRLNYHNYVATGRDTQLLDTEWLTDYVDRGSRFVSLIRRLWGTRAPIYFRSIMDMNFDDSPSIFPGDMPADTPHDPAYTSLRFAQLRTAQDELVRREGLSSIPFAQLLQGQPLGILRDEMHPTTATNRLYIELLLRRLQSAPHG